VPGINGPTSAAAIRNADDNLKQLQDALNELGLADDTNIVVAADHGFSTISKESATSPAAKADYPDAPKGALPSGFLAIDIAQGLGLPLFDPDNNNVRRADERATPRGNGLIGPDPTKPDVVVAANGGSDLVYVPSKDAALVQRVVDLLLAQDYVSGLFVDDDLGEFAGTLPLSAINLKGPARTPRPTIAVNFRSFSTGCAEPVMCTVEIADAGLQQGQGMHGSFSRADTMNFMAAIGPDFKRGFVDEAPVSNADMGQTLARLLGLKIPFKGGLRGRVVEEALPNGAMPAVTAATLRSGASAAGLQTVVEYQQVGSTRYFDAAGFPGRTIGLSEKAAGR
jgi:arylsulfatase A-like enzyme